MVQAESDSDTSDNNWHVPMGHSLKSSNQVNLYSDDLNLECYVSMADILRPKKKAKVQYLSTITLGYLHSKPQSLR